jgi:RNA-directed DNA polymerase
MMVDDWTSAENLAVIWGDLKSTRGRDGSKPPPIGVDGVSARVFDSRLEGNLREISRMLSQPSRDGGRATRYQFAPLRRKIISREPGSIRQIFVPRIRDQIVLRAIGGLIKGKLALDSPRPLDTSPRRAVKQVIAARENGCRYVLRTDIEKYYQSIPHSQLLDRVRSIKVDEIAFQLTTEILTTPLRNPAEGCAGDTRPERGVPTGASISTILGELYLADLLEGSVAADRLHMVRYMDDLLLASASMDDLKEGAACLESAIRQKGLSLSKAKTKWTSFEEGFEFLGFKFKGGKVFVSEKKSLRWIRAYQGIARKYIERVNAFDPPGAANEPLREMIGEFNRETSGATGMLVPYYSMANDLEPFRQLDRQIRRVIGGIFRRQKLAMKGEFRVESTHAWAWKYKRGYKQAMAMAKKKFAARAGAG